MNVILNNSLPNFNFISIFKNQWIVIKPNLVKESKETDPNEWESVITSPKLIREVVE